MAARNPQQTQYPTANTQQFTRVSVLRRSLTAMAVALSLVLLGGTPAGSSATEHTAENSEQNDASATGAPLTDINENLVPEPSGEPVVFDTQGVLAQLAHAEDHSAGEPAETAMSPLDDAHHTQPQWWLVTPDDIFVPLDSHSVERSEGRSGEVVRVTLSGPAIVTVQQDTARSVAEGTPQAHVEIVQAQAEAAVAEERSLTVEQLEVITPVREFSQARATPIHTVDVVYSGPQAVWPAKSTIREQTHRAMKYWSGQTDNVVRGETGSVDYLDQPALGCGSWAHAAAAAQLSGRTAYNYMTGQYPGQHLLILSYGCSGGEATLGTLQSGGWAWAGMGRQNVESNHWIIVHELGHNLGLGHGYARNCRGLAVDDVWGGGVCADVAYADMFNPMGGKSSPGVSAIPIAQRHLLLGSVAERYIKGVTPSSSGASSHVTIHALGANNGVRGVRVTPPRGDAFYIEYREPVGSDVAVQHWPMALIGAHASTAPGVRIHKARQDSDEPWSYNNYISTVLSHVRDGQRVFSFGVGDTIAPQGGSVQVTVTAMGGGSAEVRIDFAQEAEPGSAFVGPAAERIAGADRFETAVEVSQANYPSPTEVDTVVLATGGQFADALAGAPLATRLNGPLLLSGRDSLPQSTQAEIERLQPKQVILLGGTASLSSAIEKELKKKFQVKRLSGANRYDTAAEIMRFGWPTGNDELFIATGNNFPDALALGAAAASSGAPIVLVSGYDSAVTGEAARLISSSGAKQAYIAGDHSAVSDGIERDIAGKVAQVDRFAGVDRFDTATKIAQNFGAKGAPLFISSGVNFPDAIAASVYVAALPGAVLVLSRPDCLSRVVVPFFAEQQPKRVVLLGGLPSLSGSVANYQQCRF